jgi:cytochrome c-type biogenesis protein
MPIAVALLAGGLATLNPCGFALLTAFLSFYVGAQEADLPAAPTRLLQAILVGLLVTAGFLAVFTVAGVPVALGAGQLATAMPWVGLVVGLAMALVAVATLAGRPIPLGVRGLRTGGRGRRTSAMLLFGVGYGLASLGCTLPVFLVVVGASLTTTGGLAALAVFGAYALGTAVVLMALSIGAGLLRDGVARTLRRAVPHLRWINGSLLLGVSGYLSYYWAKVLFASAQTQATDPVIMFAQRSAALVQRWVDAGGSRWLLLGSASIVALTTLVALWQWTLRQNHSQQEAEHRAGI